MRQRTKKRDLSKRQEEIQMRIRVRRVARFAARQEYLANKSGIPGRTYCCPKCHAWHATSEARNECRRSHRKQEAQAT